MIYVADLAFGYVFFYLFVQRGPVKGFLCRVPNTRAFLCDYSAIFS